MTVGARRRGRALVGLVATGALIGLLGLPAAANTRDAEVTGTVDMTSAEGGSFFDIWDVGAGVDCSSPTGTVSMAGGASSGTWSLSFDTDETMVIGTTPFRRLLDADLSGGYSGSGTSGTGSITYSARRTTGPGSCTYLTGTGTCTITATAITVTGSHTVSPTPTIDPGDEGNIEGDNGPEGDLGFEVAVSGTPADCGALYGIDDGSADIDLDWTAS
jgi:hypothetical protein